MATEPTNDNGGSQLMNPHQLWAAVVISICLIAAVVTLTLMHADTTAFLALMTSVAAPVIGVILNGHMAAIRQQTNGNTSTLMAMLQRQSDIIAASQPIGTGQQQAENDGKRP